MLVDSKQKNLLGRGRPPLVEGAVMLPEFADSGAAESTVNAWLTLGEWHPFGKVDFDVSFNAGPCTPEATQSQHFVADKLVIWRVLKWQKALEKGMDFRWPVAATIPSTRAATKALTVREPTSPKLVNPCSADPKQRTGPGSTQNPGIEICNDLRNELRREAMENLFLFKPLLSPPTPPFRDEQLLPPRRAESEPPARGVIRAGGAKRNQHGA